MGELEDKISSVLSDPEQLKQISGLAQSLMGSMGLNQTDSPQEEPSLQKLMGSFLKPELQGSGGAAMLKAICPYLDEKRGRKLERAIRMSEMAKLACNFMKEQGKGYE